METRKRKCCPECKSTTISYRGSYHNYVCNKCLKVFAQPANKDFKPQALPIKKCDTMDNDKLKIFETYLINVVKKRELLEELENNELTCTSMSPAQTEEYRKGTQIIKTILQKYTQTVY